MKNVAFGMGCGASSAVEFAGTPEKPQRGMASFVDSRRLFEQMRAAGMFDKAVEAGLLKPGYASDTFQAGQAK